MTDDSTTPPKPQQADRIAKVIARAGLASRRDAERMILEGRVTVNGKRIDSPALDVLPGDRVTVDGKKLDEPQETRLWLYYKPLGLITSESDEKGRQTVFDALPRDLPRVMTVGRLDLNSEGLLLLTNDGALKRRLELPATGWLRRYRVRVNGTPNDLTFAPLRRGVTIEGEDFAPMEIRLDSQQGANAWLTVGIREGRNREIRRAMAHVGLQVNRLIRIGYGPFKLIGMEKNEVVEVKRRVLRDQLGGLLTGEVEEKDREMRPRGAGGGAEGARRPRSADRDAAGEAPRRRFAAGGGDGDGAGRTPRDGQDRPRRFGAKPAGEGRFADRAGGKPRRDGDDRPPRAAEGGKPARVWGGKPGASHGRAAGDGENRAAGKGNWRGDAPRDGKPRRFEGKPQEGGAGEGRRPHAGAGDGARPFKGPRGDGDRGPGAGFRGKPGGKPTGKPEGKGFGGKPAGRFGAKPGGKPAGRPGGRPGGQPGSRPGGGGGKRRS